jgi:hypothetical protein
VTDVGMWIAVLGEQHVPVFGLEGSTEEAPGSWQFPDGPTFIFYI